MNAKPFNESEQSQDDYCAACVHADSCNVMLKDGEDCGDRYEITAIDLTPAGRKARHDADEEADDFDRQVRETLAHWPGVQAVDLDA